MELNEWFSLLSSFTTLIVGVILWSQIRHQRSIIKRLETFIGIIDIEKVKQSSIYREEAILLKAKHETEDQIREHMTAPKMMEAYAAYVHRNNQDLFNFAFDIVLSIPDNERDAFIVRHFQVNRLVLEAMLRDYRNNPG